MKRRKKIEKLTKKLRHLEGIFKFIKNYFYYKSFTY